MKSTIAMVAGLGLASTVFGQYDPLMDEEEPLMGIAVGQDVLWNDDGVPQWESESWIALDRSFGFAAGSLSASGALSWSLGDWRVDSAWSLQPRLAVSWEMGRLTLESDGWLAWDPDSLQDGGAGAGLWWRLGGGRSPMWKTGIDAWWSDRSGAGAGIALGRNTSGTWSTSQSLRLRYLHDVELGDLPGGARRRTIGISNPTGDQGQILASLAWIHNWGSVGAGAGIDMDLRLGEAAAMEGSNAMRQGRGMSSNGSHYQTQASFDPYAKASWTPGTWNLTLLAGWTWNLQGERSTSTDGSWCRLSVSKDW